MIVDLNEADLLARMRNFEDHLVERKTVGDEKDWRKTAVAFANSSPIGLPAVLFIGVRDNGEIESPQRNLDDVQRKFNVQMQHIYPRVAYVPKIVRENGKQALAVLIPGSDLRPHFAGLSYVRMGSENIEASEAQFAELIAQRQSVVRKLAAWIGKEIVVCWRHGRVETHTDELFTLGIHQATLVDVTPDWANFRVHFEGGRDFNFSEPHGRLLLNWDHAVNKLRVEVGG